LILDLSKERLAAVKLEQTVFSKLWGLISPGSDCLAGFLKLAHTSERKAPQPNVLISWFLLMFIFVHTLESTSGLGLPIIIRES
jgi:hypothetical protein